MFIIQSDNSKSITWPVTVEIASDGGKIRKFEFTGVFNRLNDDEKNAAMAEMKSANAGDDSEAVGTEWKESTVNWIMNFMTDWKGVVDQNKAPIEFNRDNLRTAARSSIGVSLLRGINIAINEVDTGARIKN